MKIKFWGTRGSIPTPDPGTVKYGGDTSCVELRIGKTLIVFDAGTGLRRLGAHLMADVSFDGTGHILLSHFHWDHIQGFPFFRPAFVAGNTFHIYGAFKADNRLEDCLRGQMGSLYFPIEMSDMPGSFHFVELLEEEFQVAEGIRGFCRHLNHPGGCYGYRIEGPDGVVTYCTDTEPFPDRLDQAAIELARDADIFICDCQFTPEEYQAGKQGWGHSTWRDAALMAREAGVKKLVLFHHDPYHMDEDVDRILGKARELFPNTVAASRDLEIEVSKGEAAVHAPPTPNVAAATSGSAAARPSGTRPARDPSGGRPQVREEGETVIFQVSRDLAIFNSENFRKAVLESIKDEHQRAVFNLANLSFLDSAGIGSLAAIFNEAKGRGVDVVLCNPSEQILNLLRITRFNKLARIYRTEEDALGGGKPLV